MKKYKKFLTICFILALIMPFLIWLGKEIYYQTNYTPIIEKTIGLHIGSPYIDGDEVIALYSEKNSIAEEAGIKNGDILIDKYSIGNFAKKIYDASGGNFSFNVARESQIITITIPIPELLNENQQIGITSETKTDTPTGQYSTMPEYVDSAVNNHGAQPPKKFIRIEYQYDKNLKGLPLNFKTTGASAPVYIYASPDWETYDVKAVQVFYLQFINPMYSLKDPKVSQPAYWSGPLYGKLKLLF